MATSVATSVAVPTVTPAPLVLPGLPAAAVEALRSPPAGRYVYNIPVYISNSPLAMPSSIQRVLNHEPVDFTLPPALLVRPFSPHTPPRCPTSPASPHTPPRCPTSPFSPHTPPRPPTSPPTRMRSRRWMTVDSRGAKLVKLPSGLRCFVPSGHRPATFFRTTCAARLRKAR